MKSITFLYYHNIVSTIIAHFSTLVPGESLEMMVPHRDLFPKEKMMVVTTENGVTSEPRPPSFFILPKQFEVPNTFSLEALIRQAMEHVCPEVHKDFEELPVEVINGTPIFEGRPTADIEQGFWKFISMEVDYNTGLIHAIIKKI